MLSVKISTMSFNVRLFKIEVGCGLCMVIFSSVSGFLNITREPEVLPLSDKLNPNIPTTGALVVSPRIRPLPVPNGHIPRENQFRERSESGEEGGEELGVSS